MKKIIVILATFIFLTGCGCENGVLMNTPTKKVEMLLANYQTLDKDVLEQLDDVVNKEDSFNDDQRDAYRDIMKDHYKNLTYEVKDEVINGNQATVTTEIEVTDYSNVIEEAAQYRLEHEDEFKDEDGNFDESLYINYRLDKLKDAKEKVKYTIDFTLTKVDDEWKVDPLTEEQEDKIHGLYRY